MQVTYQSERYVPGSVVARYVKFDPNEGYQFCEVGDNPMWDLRQGYVTESELPRKIAKAAADRRNTWPGYVEWPMGA